MDYFYEKFVLNSFFKLFIVILCSCDADPEPLSRYCLALVKKDKPEAEHREFCLEQLDVFLQNSMLR